MFGSNIVGAIDCSAYYLNKSHPVIIMFKINIFLKKGSGMYFRCDKSGYFFYVQVVVDLIGRIKHYSIFKGFPENL